MGRPLVHDFFDMGDQVVTGGGADHRLGLIGVEKTDAGRNNFPNIVAGLAESAYGREIAVTRQFNNVWDFAIAGPPLKATRHPLFRKYTENLRCVEWGCVQWRQQCPSFREAGCHGHQPRANAGGRFNSDHFRRGRPQQVFAVPKSWSRHWLRGGIRAHTKRQVSRRSPDPAIYGPS
jgi:hypothetical protein